ncbi:Fatty acid elongation protein 3, protein [Aphelenchoides bicaudatus]|nr:Fatty acid elongation protein 3, protein [Aphelenchoides bicaudatus]
MFNILPAPDRTPPPKAHPDDFDIIQAYQTLKALRPFILALDVAYVLFIWKGAEFLANLELDRKLLRYLSVIWNGFNCITSLLMFCALLPEFLTSLSNGYHYTVCKQGTAYSGRYSGLAMYAFCLSKIWELGDTVLLAMRGRKIIFLHSFHHCIVMIQVCFTYYTAGSMARLGTVMNSGVHSIMYFYFAVQNVAPGIRCIASTITVLQMSQFVVACTGMVSLVGYVLSGHQCDTQYEMIAMHFAIYLIFLALFLKFFFNSYLSKGGQQKARIHNKTETQSNGKVHAE